MKKFKKLSKKLAISFLCVFVITTFSYPVSFANTTTETTETIEQLSVSEALSNPEIFNYLSKSNELNELKQIQNQIKNSQYNITATYVNKALNRNVTANDIKNINEKYNLDLPSETSSGIIDNGKLNVQRDNRGKILDIWYIYYLPSDSGLSVMAALIVSGNSLDSFSVTITRYYLNNSTWTKLDSTSSRKTNVKNGVIFKWSVSKWGVKEKFEYNTVITDNGFTHKFNNINKNNITRYNFEAKPYNTLNANGGQRHHFIPATSLKNNGFNSNTAYCIRMMTSDHKRTASYGNSSYVNKITNLLKNRKYQEALQTEVNSLKSAYDSEGIAGTLQQKYYNQVLTCLYQYEILFGIN